MAKLVPFNKPPEKNAPKPSKLSIDKAKYFELKLIDVALDAYKKQQYLKSAMMSWSFIEEFFLPNAIEFIARQQKINADEILKKAKGIQLINYYYLVSLDEEVYKKLCEANTLRNILVHHSYKSKSIEDIAKNAKKSANCNFDVFSLVAPRLKGEVNYPSLTLYSRGWNDYREKTLKMLDERKRELEKELSKLRSK